MGVCFDTLPPRKAQLSDSEYWSVKNGVNEKEHSLMLLKSIPANAYENGYRDTKPVGTVVVQWKGKSYFDWMCIEVNQ